MINSNEIFKKAVIEKYAIPQFNITNLEWIKYILEKCEELKSPVILGASEGAIKYMGGYNVVYSIVNAMIKDLNIRIPVVLHLDHGTSVDSCKKAIDAGFTSVMIDSSKNMLEENIRITKEVVDYALKRNVSIEAEVGSIGGIEDNISANIRYADVNECIKFVEETGVTSLAPALGTVHGFYKGELNIDFERMKKIKESVKVPLVLHGGTGVNDYLIKESVNIGISKINIDTELKSAWNEAVRNFIGVNKTEYDPRKIISSGEEAIKNVIDKKINLFGSKNKA